MQSATAWSKAHVEVVVWKDEFLSHWSMESDRCWEKKTKQMMSVLKTDNILRENTAKSVSNTRPGYVKLWVIQEVYLIF